MATRSRAALSLLSGAQRQLAVSSALLAVASTSQLHAATINYGNFSDVPPGGVMYLDVTETANSAGDDEPLHGLPSIRGNHLDFDPAGFSSTSRSGGSDGTGGRLSMAISAVQGSSIESLKISGRGDATLFGSGTATVSDTMTGRNPLGLGSPGDAKLRCVWSVAFSPDGKRIVTAAGDPVTEAPGEVKVSDAWTGQDVLALLGHDKQAFCVAWSPDGQRIATGSFTSYARGVVKLWDAGSFTENFHLVTDREGMARFIAEAAPQDGVLEQLAESASDNGCKLGGRHLTGPPPSPQEEHSATHRQ